MEGRTQFLSAVCMSCLEGSGGQPVRCRCCTQPWDGSSLVLGTMYSYDIFAAMPCCTERLKVTNSLSLHDLQIGEDLISLSSKKMFIQFHFFHPIESPTRYRLMYNDKQTSDQQMGYDGARLRET